MRIVQTRRGARILQGRHVLSEILRVPGPTHSVFDVLAACAAVVQPKRVAMLGFAGGGMVAPLRALGCQAQIEAVDLSLEGAETFEALSSAWSGNVVLDQADACRWLQAKRSRFDVVVEDLSIDVGRDVVKPEVSLTELPTLIASRLNPSGMVVTNVVETPGMGWTDLLESVSFPFDQALFVEIGGFENRVVLGGTQLPKAREMGSRLRLLLRHLGSTLADEIVVRTLSSAKVQAPEVEEAGSA